MNDASEPTGYVDLTQEQRRALFDTYGVNVRRLAIGGFPPKGRVVDRTCVHCLLSTDLPNVAIDASGLCNHCRDFQASADPPAAQTAMARERIREKRGGSDYDCVVAFSGGKDSAAALMLAQQEFGLRPIAVLVDNGFIPHEVKASAKAFCKRAGAPLLIREIDIAPAARSSLRNGVKTVPCTSCMRGIFGRIVEDCRALGTRLVIGGHRFPPLAFSVQGFTRDQADEDIMCVSVLLACRIPESEQLAMIHSAGWRRPQIAGNTSNCRLIGYVEREFYLRNGYNLHVYEVSKEIRAGFYSRQEGFEKLGCPTLTDDHRLFVEDRLR